MSTDLAIHQLERHADEARCEALDQARGRCLHATVELARQARALGLADRVWLLRWRVRNDIDFLEHWALRVGDDLVLDMTAVQVDGSPRVARCLAEYPPNYGRPAAYPLPLVLAVVDAAAPAAGTRYSRRLLWALHRRLARHDARRAWGVRSAAGLLGAGGAMAHAAFTLCAGYVLEHAIARMSRLLLRLE